jgi:GAF domain-containing protein
MADMSTSNAFLQAWLHKPFLHSDKDAIVNEVLNLFRIFSNFNDITCLSTDKQTALQTMVMVCQQVLGSHACALTLVDLASGMLTYGAGISTDKALEEALRTGQVRIGPQDLPSCIPEIAAYYGLQQAGQGILDTHIATDYHVQAGLCCPVQTQGQFLGYLWHFTAQREPFRDYDKTLLEVCAAQVANALERFEEKQTRERLHKLFHELSEPELFLSSEILLQRITAGACELLRLPVAIVWMLDTDAEQLKIRAATPNVDERYRTLELRRNHFESWAHLFHDRVASLLDVRATLSYYEHAAAARERGWVSLLSAPLRAQNGWIGMLDVYTVKQPRHFHSWEKDAFHALAHYAALATEKARLHAWQEVATIREKIDRLSNTSQPDSQPGHQLDAALDWIVTQCATVTRAKTCYLRLLNKVTNQLELRAFYDTTRPLPQRPLPRNNSLPVGAGVAGHVAQTGKAYICPHTREDPYYKGRYPGKKPRATLCIPLLAGNAVIGTLSIGSNVEAAFGQTEQRLLESLAESIVVAIERARLMDSLLILASIAA